MLSVMLLAAATLADARGEPVRVNGMPLQVVERIVRESPSEVVGALRAAWASTDAREPGGEMRQQRLGAHELLSRQRGTLHETVLVAPLAGRRGSRIVHSILDLAAKPGPLPKAPMAWPRNARLLSVVEPAARGSRAPVEFLLLSLEAPAVVAVVWSEAVRASGWSSSRTGGGGCREARRGNQSLHWCLRGTAAGTTVVLQWRP